MSSKRAAEPTPGPNDAAPAAPGFADAITKMAEAHPDLMQIVEDVADVQPELAGRLIEVLRRILGERKEAPASPVSPSPVELPPPVAPAAPQPIQSDAAREAWREERAAYYRQSDAGREECAAYYRRRPAPEDSGWAA